MDKLPLKQKKQLKEFQNSQNGQPSEGLKKLMREHMANTLQTNYETATPVTQKKPHGYQIRERQTIQRSGSINADDERNPCWKGYVKVPGKADYEKGSCKKK
jgi:hypothetical protein